MSRVIGEKGLIIVSLVTVMFLMFNYDFTVMAMLGFMLFVDWNMLQGVKYKNILLTHGRAPMITAVAVGLFAFAGFLVFSSVVLTYFGYITGGLASALTFMTNYTTQPILATNRYVQLFVWGVVIPFIETRFFCGRMLEFLSPRFKTTLQFDPRNISLWIVTIASSALATLFHLTAKFASGDGALMITFMFFIISCWMVIYFRELKQAIWFHVINNSIVVILALGLFGLSLGAI
jgi:hypothetical protein